jgi:hypothetical protein
MTNTRVYWINAGCTTLCLLGFLSNVACLAFFSGGWWNWVSAGICLISSLVCFVFRTVE